jgi:succinate dehydrogenase/fumarate reductase flavoprotein subunit
MPHVAAMPSAAGLKALNTAGGLKAEPVRVPTNWAQSADVVIVGYGSAGAIAAMTAFDAGANVLILEKTPSLATLGVANNNTDETSISGGGGNSHICGGSSWYITDPVAHTAWMNRMCFGATPMDTCEAWAFAIAQNLAWYKANNIPCSVGATPSLTGEYQAFGPIGNSYSIAAVSPITNTADSGMALFKALDNAVQSRGIPVLFNCRGTSLIQNPVTNEILGVVALQNQSELVNIQAKRAVILTTGGFEFDARMKLNYLKCAPYHFGGWQYNTGDGINMALQVGAGLWHMNTTSGRLSPWFPLHNTAYAQEHHNNAWFWTNRYGSRFVNEVQTQGLTTQSIPSHSTWQAVVGWNFQYGEYSCVPTLQIIDSTGITNGPAVSAELPKQAAAQDAAAAIVEYGTGINVLPAQLGGTGALGGFTGSAIGTYWSYDNSVELAKGWIIQGADVPTLAANIAKATIVGSNQGMAVPDGWNSIESMDNVTLPGGTSCPNFSAANLTAAVNQWNADCAAGKGDTVFGRLATSMAPLSTPPFYAIPIWPSGPNTNGGPIHNAKGQTCDPYYNPIPRLYSAGELGSTWGFLYQGGGNITESVAYGRIVGNNAAMETPWA